MNVNSALQLDLLLTYPLHLFAVHNIAHIRNSKSKDSMAHRHSLELGLRLDPSDVQGVNSCLAIPLVHLLVDYLLWQS